MSEPANSPAPGSTDADLVAIGVEPDDVNTSLLVSISVAMVVVLIGLVGLGYGLFKWQVGVELQEKGYQVDARAPRPGASAQ